MTLSVLLYGAVVGLLLGAAAHFLDRGARALGRPSRGIWTAAMVGTLLAPGLPLVLPQAPASNTPSGSPLPLELLYGMGALGAGAAGSDLSPGRVFGALWAVGSLLILGLVFWTALRLRRKAAGWEPASVGEEEVLISDGVGPAVLGFFRPQIILPRSVLALDPRELEVILLHEGEHRRARDPALLGASILLIALSPWNPALWWILRRLRLAVEGDCDARVLARGIGRRRYGAVLLKIASGHRGPFTLAPALTEGGKGFLERRLQMMKESVRRHRGWSAVGAALVGGALVVLACETPVPPTSLEPDSDMAAAPVLEVTEPGDLMVSTGSGTARVEIEDGSTVTVSGDLIALEEPKGLVYRFGAESGGPPLVIIDGVIISPELNWMELVDTATIESVEVIKGGAARALYGERAANGLIRITTKH